MAATDPLNNTVQLAYFGGDLTSIIDPTGNVTTRFADSVGRVTATVDAQGHKVTSQYNSLNLVTSATVGGEGLSRRHRRRRRRGPELQERRLSCLPLLVKAEVPRDEDRRHENRDRASRQQS
jgi:YD repeat-containing protein